jgi:hypothetical protein
MFFVTGLPRSRTAWLAAFLSTGGVLCHHELMGHVHSVEEFIAEMERPLRGNADHGLFLFPEFARRWPKAPVVVIHRDIENVQASLLAMGIDQRDMLEENLEFINSLDAMHVLYDDIDDRLREICRHVRVPYDAHRAQLFRRLNIQTTNIAGDPEQLAMWRERAAA